jgi:hypothetical protein
MDSSVAIRIQITSCRGLFDNLRNRHTPGKTGYSHCRLTVDSPRYHARYVPEYRFYCPFQPIGTADSATLSLVWVFGQLYVSLAQKCKACATMNAWVGDHIGFLHLTVCGSKPSITAYGQGRPKEWLHARLQQSSGMRRN